MGFTCAAKRSGAASGASQCDRLHFPMTGLEIAHCFACSMNAKYANATNDSRSEGTVYQSFLNNSRTRIISGIGIKSLSSEFVESIILLMPYNAIGMTARKAATINLEVFTANNSDE